MPTSVLQLDFENLPPLIDGLERYNHTLVLVRYRGRPVGQARLTTRNGTIPGAELREEVLKATLPVVCDCWLRDYLAFSEEASLNSVVQTGTIAVCTRDRPEDLNRCLGALGRFAGNGFEVLVIDSCSKSEETKQVVERHGFARYVREERPGLNVARNRALREALHDHVAFTDDDAVPDPGWAAALLRNFADPLVLAVTGLTMPLELETEAQEWFERYSPFNRGFRRVVFDRRKCNPLAPSRVGAGANMALRRRTLSCVGAFDEALDAGTPTCSGGETEMFSRILSGGYRIVYDPAALSWHRHRRSWEELRKAMRGYGAGVYAFWTRRLTQEREWRVLPVAWHWFYRYQLRGLARSFLRRPASVPADLLWAELRGCAAGPWLYFQSRRQSLRRMNGND